MAAAMPSWACHEKPIERTQSKLFLHGDSSLILGPAVNASNTSRPGIDSVSEWLRRWTRNPLGSARVGSNPTGVDIVRMRCYFPRNRLSILTDEPSPKHRSQGAS